MFTRALLTLGLLVYLPGHLRADAPPPHAIKQVNECIVFVRTANTAGTGIVVGVHDGSVYCVTDADLLPMIGQTCQVTLFPDSPRTDVVEGKVLRRTAGGLALIHCETPLRPRAVTKSFPKAPEQHTPLYQFSCVQDGDQAPMIEMTRTMTIAPITNLKRINTRPSVVENCLGSVMVDARGGIHGLIMTSNQNLCQISLRSTWDSFLRGSIERLTLHKTQDLDDRQTYEVELHVVDPLNQITGVSSLVGLTSQQRGAARRTSPMQGARTYSLRMRGDQASGTIRTIGSEQQSLQLKVRRGRKETRYYTPLLIREGNFVQSNLSFHARPSKSATMPPKQPSTVRTPARRDLLQTLPPVRGQFPLVREALTKTVSLPMPAAIEEAKLAGGGRLLVLRLLDIPALVVVDLVKAEAPRYIQLPSSTFVYGAGGNRALVYLPDGNVLHTYNLTSGERERAKPNPTDDTLQSILMGYGRGNLAICKLVNQDQPGAKYLIDTDTLNLLPVDFRDALSFSRLRARMLWRANADLSAYGIWNRRNRAMSYGVSQWDNGRYESVGGTDNGRGYLIPGADGYTYTGSGAVLDQNWKEQARFSGRALVPDLSGKLFLGVAASGQVTVYTTSGFQPLVPMPNCSVTRSAPTPGMMQTDERVTFVPEFRRLAVISEARNQLEIHDFDLEAILRRVDVDYLFVQSTPTTQASVGQPWRYPIRVVSNRDEITYTIEIGPKNMRIGDDGVVQWIPAERPTSPTVVVIRIQNDGGEHTYHKFTVPFADRE